MELVQQGGSVERTAGGPETVDGGQVLMFR